LSAGDSIARASKRKIARCDTKSTLCILRWSHRWDLVTPHDFRADGQHQFALGGVAGPYWHNATGIDAFNVPSLLEPNRTQIEAPPGFQLFVQAR